MIAILRSVLLIVTMAQAAAAQEVKFALQATLNYDANRVVSASGGTLGALLAEFFGPTAAQGQVSLIARLAYLTNTPVTAGSANIAGYSSALTDAEIEMGGNTVRLNLPLVMQNAASSKIGLVVRSDAEFCVDTEHCEQVGVPNAPWGSMALVFNNISHTMIDQTGRTTFVQNDVIGFMAGRTDPVGEFDPIFQTQGFGQVSVDGFAMGLFSTPGQEFFSSRALPPMDQLVGTQAIGRSEFWLFLEGPQLTQIQKLEGVITRIELLK